MEPNLTFFPFLPSWTESRKTQIFSWSSETPERLKLKNSLELIDNLFHFGSNDFILQAKVNLYIVSYFDN